MRVGVSDRLGCSLTRTALLGWHPWASHVMVSRCGSNCTTWTVVLKPLMQRVIPTADGFFEKEIPVRAVE